jgi:ABC-2 type transport system ATP-binding protein
MFDNDNVMTDSQPKEYIKVSNLTKFYKKFMALDNISLSLKSGNIIGLLGKNGAGKSTLMRCILGFLKHNGQIFINNEEVVHQDTEIFNYVGFIPDVNELDNRLTVRQIMEYMSEIHIKWNQSIADKLLKISQLPLDKKIDKLSKGMKTKLYLLITLSLDVNILLLDEPTIGLDIAFRKEFFNTIISEFFNENKLILISTHQIEEIESLLQEIIIIDNGKLILHKNLDELKSEYNMVTIPIERAEDLEQYNPKYKTKTLGYISAILPSNIKIEGAQYNRPQTSEIFLNLTGGYNVTD